jgi:tetratricopeptide (TPR) repeat protein
MTTSAHADLERVRQLRLLGELQAAESLAGEIIDQSETSPADEFALRLELARIHDRYGLHFRRRPVTAALAEIDKATELARDLADSYQAQARLARAYYYYRAEMSGREFPVAIRLLEEALVLMPETSDYHDRAEAVHLRGLIHLQMRELDLARQRFDESLNLISRVVPVFFSGVSTNGTLDLSTFFRTAPNWPSRTWSNHLRRESSRVLSMPVCSQPLCWPTSDSGWGNWTPSLP